MLPSDGASFGNYQILGRLGEGGTANVFLAVKRGSEQLVALKILQATMSSDSQALARFEREVTVVAALNHPNILTLYDYGVVGNRAYMAVEYLAGGTLQERLGIPLPIVDILAILKPLCAALHHAHTRGVIHRDIKPSNVLFDVAGRIVLGDFGLAKLRQGVPDLTVMTGGIIGTPHYTSPEVVLGQTVTPISDIYSLGVMTYYMACGKLPFDQVTLAAVLYAHIYESPPSLRAQNPDIPPSVEMVILRALSKQPTHRFKTVEEYFLALERASANHASPSNGIPSQPRGPDPLEALNAAPPALVDDGRELFLRLVEVGQRIRNSRNNLQYGWQVAHRALQESNVELRQLIESIERLEGRNATEGQRDSGTLHKLALARREIRDLQRQVASQQATISNILARIYDPAHDGSAERRLLQLASLWHRNHHHPPLQKVSVLNGVAYLEFLAPESASTFNSLGATAIHLMQLTLHGVPRLSGVGITFASDRAPQFPIFSVLVGREEFRELWPSALTDQHTLDRLALQQLRRTELHAVLDRESPTAKIFPLSYNLALREADDPSELLGLLRLDGGAELATEIDQAERQAQVSSGVPQVARWRHVGSLYSQIAERVLSTFGLPRNPASAEFLTFTQQDHVHYIRPHGLLYALVRLWFWAILADEHAAAHPSANLRMRALALAHWARCHEQMMYFLQRLQVEYPTARVRDIREARVCSEPIFDRARQTLDEARSIHTSDAELRKAIQDLARTREIP